VATRRWFVGWAEGPGFGAHPIGPSGPSENDLNLSSRFGFLARLIHDSFTVDE